PFTVIFDTGSAVFGVFVVKHDLPMSIRAQLPDDMISTSLYMLEQKSSSTATLPLAGVTNTKFAAGVVIFNLCMVALVLIYRRKRRSVQYDTISHDDC
ncbi:hypothetical protein GUITHDRAFT_152917, partial [Guillardia theta CCMP2712]